MRNLAQSAPASPEGVCHADRDRSRRRPRRDAPVRDRRPRPARDRRARWPADEAAAQAIAPGEQAAPDPARQIADSMPTDGVGEASTGTAEDPFVGRDPIVSMLQTSVEAKLHEEGLVSEAPREDGHGFLSRLWHKIEGLIHPQKYGPEDPHWVTAVAKAMLERLAAGQPPVQPRARRARRSPTTRAWSSWATGGPASRARRRVAEHHGRRGSARRSRRVARRTSCTSATSTTRATRRSTTATCSIPAGGRSPAEQARRGVTSWALNGNHDMYSGGWGYFDHLLADERFGRQRGPRPRRASSGSARRRGASSAWTRHGSTDVAHAEATPASCRTRRRRVAAWADEPTPRKLVLLSHHQYVTDGRSAGDRREVERQGGSRGRGRARDRVALGSRAALHGIPDRRRSRSCAAWATAACPCRRRPADGRSRRPAVWEVPGELRGRTARRWGSFGFAVLDLDGERIDASYRDDAGTETRSRDDRLSARNRRRARRCGRHVGGPP